MISQQRRYKEIFFDLDNTLWDFHSNCLATFKEIFDAQELNTTFKDIKQFVSVYDGHNEVLWAMYREGSINKDFLRKERFARTLRDFGIPDLELAATIGAEYMRICPMKGALMPNAFKTLDYLGSRYRLHIITNGFRETQEKKLKASGLENYFATMVTSDDLNIKKPRPEIFEHAITRINARKADCLMIGDDLEVDILGAKQYGIDHVYFNFKHKSHQEKGIVEITSLAELRDML